jgi:DNA-binding IclR family transcriptional regulator
VPHLDDNTLRVMEVLARHPALDTLQIASRAELAVSAAGQALEQLRNLDLLTGDSVYSLNEAKLNELLETEAKRNELLETA